MNDFLTLKDIFEMAEMLESETENALQVQLVNSFDNKTVNVFFVFGPDGELIGGYAED